MIKYKPLFALVMMIFVLLIVGTSVRYFQWSENAEVCDDNGGAILNTMLASADVECYMWKEGYKTISNGKFKSVKGDVLLGVNE